MEGLGEGAWTLVVPVVAALLLLGCGVLPELLLPVVLPDRSGCWTCLQAQLTPLSQLQGWPEAS